MDSIWLDNEAPFQQAMVYYFDPPQDAKKYSGRKRKYNIINVLGMKIIKNIQLITFPDQNALL